MRTVVVKSGDTLSGLALQHLGSADRWPAILRLNAEAITTAQKKVARQRAGMVGPNWIFPGLVLTLPPGAAQTTPSSAV